MSKRISPQTGLLLAGVGAAGVLGSLWLPWYTVRVPQAFRDLFSKLGGGGSPSASSSPSDQIGAAFAGMMKGLMAAIPDEITGTGWQTMGSADWVLAVVSGLVLLAALAIGGGLSGVRADAGQVGRFIAFAGAVCGAIAVYHVVRSPGAGAGGASASLPGLEDAITVRYGAYVAAIGGLLMLAGGLFASNAKAAPALAADGAPAAPAYTPPAPYAPATADPFAAPDPAPAPMPAADPFGAGAAPAPVMSTPMAPDPPSAMPAADPFATPATPSAPAMNPSPPAAAPREPGSSVAPPGWAPPGV